MWNLSNPIAVSVQNFVMKYGPDRLMKGAFERMMTTDL